jgi:glucose/arabinose dehydrogenase
MAAEVPEGVWVREGYTLSVAVDSIRKPRFMALDERGGMFVSVPSEGTIYRCEDKDGDGHYESKTTFLEGYESGKVLQGVQFYDGSLWCADMNHIYRATDRDQDGKAEEVKVIVGEDQLPITGGGHKWRALLIHQDRIYTHVGDQSNATDEPITENDRKKIWTFALDGSGKELFATGIRNTEKLVVRPGSDEIGEWITTLTPLPRSGSPNSRNGGSPLPITTHPLSSITTSREAFTGIPTYSVKTCLI